MGAIDRNVEMVDTKVKILGTKVAQVHDRQGVVDMAYPSRALISYYP